MNCMWLTHAFQYEIYKKEHGSLPFYIKCRSASATLSHIQRNTVINEEIAKYVIYSVRAVRGMLPNGNAMEISPSIELTPQFLWFMSSSMVNKWNSNNPLCANYFSFAVVF